MDIIFFQVWPKGKTVFPDFLNPKTRDVWKQLIAEQHKTLGFDGLWIVRIHLNS